MSLYRRYRPQSFEDIVGQAHVTRTLVNALTEDRLHHAYLFTGPRGTGKTSIARILAKAINCDVGPTPNPCNTCDNCVEITAGSSVDVIELDMASHGGVEDARELRDRASFAPARSRRKVYILDEVHMASTAAFNALLKLIEEPPSHVLFTMATTDPQKVLPTILSRVQRLDLRRVDADAVAAHVARICAAEGQQMDQAAIDAVVRAGDGSVRDTLSVLEQVVAFADGDITVDTVTRVLGRTPDDEVFAVADAIARHDVGAVLVAVQHLVDQGIDLRRFTLDFAHHVRDLLVVKVAPDRLDLVDGTTQQRQRLQQQAATLSQTALLDIARVLGDAIVEQRQTSPRLPLELALARLAVVSVAEGRASSVHVATAADDTEANAEPHTSPPLEAVADAAAADANTPASGSDTWSDATDEVPLADEVPLTEDASTAPPTADSPSDAPDTPVAAEPGFTRAAEPEQNGTAIGLTGAVPVADDGELAGSEAAGETAAESQEEADKPANTADDRVERSEQLAKVVNEWPAILEIIKQQSRRCHALFEPAKPTRVGRGMLTLRYGRRYASFHAVNAGKAEFADVLRTAIKARCDLDVRLEIITEGDDDRRRPLPPSMTPDDARTPVLDEPAAPDDGVDVREAESNDVPTNTDVAGLLASELGAELLEERAADPGVDDPTS